MLMISLQVAEPFRGPREVNGRGCEDALCRIGANEPWVIRLRPTYKFTPWGRETIVINIMVTRNLARLFILERYCHVLLQKARVFTKMCPGSQIYLLVTDGK